MGALLSKLRGGGGASGGRDRAVAYRNGDISPAARGSTEDGKSLPREAYSSEDDDDGSSSGMASVSSSQRSRISGRADAVATRAAWNSVPDLKIDDASQSSIDGDSLLPGATSALSSTRSSARPAGGRAAGRFAPGFGRGMGRGGRGGGRWSRASRARVKQGLPPLPDAREAPRLSTAHRDRTGAALLDLINHGVAAVLTPEPGPEESSDSELDELQSEVDKFEEMARKQAEALVGLNPLSDPSWVKQHST